MSRHLNVFGFILKVCQSIEVMICPQSFGIPKIGVMFCSWVVGISQTNPHKQKYSNLSRWICLTGRIHPQSMWWCPGFSHFFWPPCHFWSHSVATKIRRSIKSHGLNRGFFTARHSRQLKLRNDGVWRVEIRVSRITNQAGDQDSQFTMVWCLDEVTNQIVGKYKCNTCF